MNVSLVKINVDMNKVGEEHDQLVVTSKQVADDFGKKHQHVLRDIDGMKDVPSFGEMFYETQEPDSYGRMQL